MVVEVPAIVRFNPMVYPDRIPEDDECPPYEIGAFLIAEFFSPSYLEKFKPLCISATCHGFFKNFAVPTRLERATPTVTEWCSNQLNYETFLKNGEVGQTKESYSLFGCGSRRMSRGGESNHLHYSPLLYARYNGFRRFLTRS